MSHRDTQVAWDIDSEEPVYIGDRREWELHRAGEITSREVARPAR